jgi:hypothetical protein
VIGSFAPKGDADCAPPPPETRSCGFWLFFFQATGIDFYEAESLIYRRMTYIILAKVAILFLPLHQTFASLLHINQALSGCPLNSISAILRFPKERLMA